MPSSHGSTGGLLLRSDDGIVVVRSRREHVVDVQSVSPALRARLGPDATSGLVELLDLSRQESRDAVISACTERFERRLVEEISKIRVDVAHLGADLRQEMAAGRVELFRWCFLFWIGQVLAIGGLMGVMLRLAR